MTGKASPLFTKITEEFKLSAQDKKLLESILSCGIDLAKCDFVVSKIIQIRLDKESVFAYLAYQLYKIKCPIYEQITSEISEEELGMEETLKSLINLKSITKSEEYDDIRKMFLAISKDVRVVIIKLSSILYETSQLKIPLSADEKIFVQQVKEIHIPLAERLGLDVIKLDLDDNCIRLEHPKDYEHLKTTLDSKKDDNLKQMLLTKSRLEESLKELKISGEIAYRQKHISSIYKKLNTKGLTFDQIYDLIAMRVIVSTIEECYMLLGRIHSMYKPMSGRFKDYIATPKPNGYKSLHTTVIVENMHPMEIQIRTFSMHKESEFGSYAHWLYKEKATKKNILDQRITLLRETIENAKDMSPEEFVNTLKADLYNGLIFVQTPKGRVLEFPEGATAIDFAYAIHSDIGNACVGVKINNKMVPISTTLKNGDIIEILTSNTSKGPSRDWLNIAKTNSARSKIRSFFKTELKEDNIKNGKVMFEQTVKDKEFAIAELLTEKYTSDVLTRYGMKDIEELYASIGSASLTALQAVNKFVSLWVKDNEQQKFVNTVVNVISNKDGVLIDGDSGMLIRFGGCCKPIEGDTIYGYISRGKGVTIHRKDCPNLKYLENERLIGADWAGNKNASSQAKIKIIADKLLGMVNKITSVILKTKIVVSSIQAKDSGDSTVCELTINVKNIAELNKVIDLLHSVKGVNRVYRSDV